MTFSSINFSLDQLILIVVENSLVLFMSAESYIMKIHCSWFVEECHTGIYCHKQKSWKYSLKCNTMEFNNSSWSISYGLCRCYLWECFISHTKRLYMAAACLFLNYDCIWVCEMSFSDRHSRWTTSGW